MAKFSEKSISKLETCHKDLQTIFNEVILRLPFESITDITIKCGFRGKTEQHQAFLSHHSKLDWPKGNHNSTPSLAVDVIPSPNTWKQYKELAELVCIVFNELLDKNLIKNHIKWGGCWLELTDLTPEAVITYFDKFKGFKDGAHFEICK